MCIRDSARPALCRDRRPLAHDRSDDREPRQPQLLDGDAVEVGVLRDADLHEVGLDLVERRDLDLDVDGLVARDAQQLGDQGQRRRLQQGEHDDVDQHDVEDLVGPRRGRRQRDGRHDDGLSLIHN